MDTAIEQDEMENETTNHSNTQQLPNVHVPMAEQPIKITKEVLLYKLGFSGQLLHYICSIGAKEHIGIVVEEEQKLLQNLYNTE